MIDGGYTLLQTLQMEMRLFFYLADNKTFTKICATGKRA